MLDDHQLLKYSRQIMLPEIDVAGQEKIVSARVLIVGAGGLGCPVAMYLAAAGVGELILVDHDSVELTNLQRQIAHQASSIGSLKTESAASTVCQLNPECKVQVVSEKLTDDNMGKWVDGVDLIVDCTDNFVTRFLLNRCSVNYKIPLVSGAAIRMEGQVAVFDPRNGDAPCYRCLYEEGGQEDQRCSTNGVLAPVVGVIGSIQAVEALKVLTNLNGTLTGRVLVMDALNMDWRTVKLKKDPSCPVCSSNAGP